MPTTNIVGSRPCAERPSAHDCVTSFTAQFADFKTDLIRCERSPTRLPQRDYVPDVAAEVIADVPDQASG